MVNIDSGEKEIAISEENNSQLFHPQHLTETLWFPDIALQDNEELTHSTYLSSEMQFGLQFHLLISRIEKIEDIEPMINAAIQEGEVESKNTKQLTIKLKELLDSTDYISLFKNKKDVINEQAILIDSTTTLRPDKIILKEDETIIIDYKTGIPNQKDQKQVNTYKQVLEEMGYPKVCCYLFYSSINELRQVS